MISHRLQGSRARPRLAGKTRSARWSAPAARFNGQAIDDVRREFLRDLGADLRYWYGAAESKAQLVLTVNGVFLTFLTTSALAGGQQLTMAMAVFGSETWVFLGGMSACMALAILSAVVCLASRGLSRAELQRRLTDLAVEPDSAATYPPDLAVFFHDLSALQPGQFADRIMTCRQDFITNALATDIIEFAPYVVAKHRWVNRAFIFTGLTLTFFLCTGVGYLVRLHLSS